MAEGEGGERAGGGVMAVLAAIVCAGLLQAPAAAAQDVRSPVEPARLEAARELVEAMRLRERWRMAFADRSAGDGKLIDDCIKANDDPAAPATSKGDCMAKLEQFHRLYDPEADRLAPAAREKLVAAAADAYARQLLPADLRELAAFYQSPIGRRYVAIGPALDAELAAAQTDIQLQFMIDVLGAVATKGGKK